MRWQPPVLRYQSYHRDPTPHRDDGLHHDLLSGLGHALAHY